jgi:hypothetical protein
MVARSRHPAFSPTIARQAVRGHSWDDLVAGWQVSSRVLARERSPGHRLALVNLRAAILDELEATDPCLFRRWLAVQELARGRRRPA